MRVALLQNFVAPYRVVFYERLAARLDAFRVFVSTPMESDRQWAVEWGSLDVVVQRNVTLRRPYRDSLGFSRELQLHVPYDTIARLWQFRPDAVISVELGARSLQAVIYKLLRPRVRLLIWCKLSEHSERNWGRARHTLRRFILRHADGVLVNGESGARYIAKFGVPDRLIARINQPVDVSRFAAVPRTRDAGLASRLLCAGTLTARKGIMPFAHALIAWAKAHPDRSIEIWWLGDGELAASLAALVLPPNLTQRLCGSVSYADMPGYYAQCDLLAFPSLLDEWGLVVNEAMAAGLPVLGSTLAQAVTELIEDGHTGWVFDASDAAGMRAAIDRALAAGPDQVARMRDAARARIARLTPDTAAARIAAALIGENARASAHATTLVRPRERRPRPAAARPVSLAADDG
jgi:glycosyltransferase involved in cell wall biosynthesis